MLCDFKGWPNTLDGLCSATLRDDVEAYRGCTIDDQGWWGEAHEVLTRYDIARGGVEAIGLFVHFELCAISNTPSRQFVNKFKYEYLIVLKNVFEEIITRTTIRLNS